MEMLSAVRRSSVGIGIFAVVTAGLIAITQVSTKDIISHNVREQQAKALYEIVPRDSIDNDLLEDTFAFVAPELQGSEQPADAYRARRNGVVETVILPVVAPDGYSGKISFIIGIQRDGSVAGLRVLAHKETPGLGDKVDLKKSGWVLSFNGERKAGRDDSDWAVIKDGGRFDQFTGATITPRAVVNAAGRAIDYFQRHREMLLDELPKNASQESN